MDMMMMMMVYKNSAEVTNNLRYRDFGAVCLSTFDFPTLSTAFCSKFLRFLASRCVFMQ